jgi:hypothetical protein
MEAIPDGEKGKVKGYERWGHRIVRGWAGFAPANPAQPRPPQPEGRRQTGPRKLANKGAAALQLTKEKEGGMEHDMGYVVLLLLAAPLAVVWLFILAIATGLIHEPTAAESVAHNYGTSWKTVIR